MVVSEEHFEEDVETSTKLIMAITEVRTLEAKVANAHRLLNEVNAPNFGGDIVDRVAYVCHRLRVAGLTNE